MPEIQILPMSLSVRTRKGETLRDALYRAGVEIESPCNGQGLCGKCLVRVESPDDVPETPHKEISPEQARQGIRLACQLVPASDMTVHVISQYRKDEHRILEGDRDEAFSERKREKTGAMRRHLSSTESLVNNVPAAILDFSDSTCRLEYDGQTPEELRDWPANATAKGLAIDLGTTTMVVSLVELTTGRELATTSSLNPQIRFGHDVIRRIEKGSTPEGLAELSQCVREGLNNLIQQACQDSGADPMEVLDVVLGGNTTMLQLAASIDPEPLGQVPFSVALQGGRAYPVQQFGLEVNSAARVYVPPIVHAYVGADISAGLLVSRRFFKPGEAMFFVDVGTNGEMGLSANGQYLMTSTAAGPAFEGMGISAGMRARIGAVEGVETDGHARLDVHT
ncbi:MAG: ASKHA domain-containing protein, partial [Desulfosalsimonas sp.]